MSADRDWLEQRYLPTLEGRILFVGVNDYTQSYPSLIKGGIFESLDSCPVRSNFGGTSTLHHNVSILEFEDEALYDHVSVHGCHGCIGHNINNSRIREEIIKLSSLVKPGGTFQFGPACGYVPQYEETHWREFIKEAPFTEYTFIHNKVEPPNYIFWGKKNEE